MKSKEIKAMDVSEIRKKMTELRKELVKLNSQVASGSSLKSPSLIRNTKKTVARLTQELERKEAING